MKLRRATPADAGKLALLGGAAFLETFARDHDGDEVVTYVEAEHARAYYHAALTDPGKAAWLVEEAVGCPVGYALAVPASLPYCHPLEDYELKRIYMLSRWQGSGFGARLYDAVEAEARERQARRLVLSVYVENHPAQRFYASRGFSNIGRWLFEGFEGSEDFILAKTL